MATIEVNPSIYFECPVCMEEINDTWKMLPCQHVFCLGCLRAIFEEAGRNQNPQCPTCRQVIAVPLEQLQKPRLLYELHENLKISQQTRATRNDVDDDLIAAIELHSIDDARQRQEEIDKENEHLQIALCKSADEASLRAEIESLLFAEEEDLITAVELSIQENNERSSIHPAAKEPAGTSRNDGEPGSKIPFYFSLSDFNNNLKANGNFVLDTMLTAIEDDETLNSLESSEIVLYLKAIDRYLNTLKRFRKNQIDGIIKDFGERSERYKNNLTLRNRDGLDDSHDREDNAFSNNNEDDLTNLISALEAERNEDAILKIVIKKSEVLDPLDDLCNQFLKIRKMLDRAFVNAVTKPKSHDSVEKLMGSKYFPPPMPSHIPVEHFSSSFLQQRQVNPSPSLPPASSLILPLPTVSHGNPVPNYSSHGILPRTPRTFPTYSNSRGQQKVSSERRNHAEYSNDAYHAGENYRGNRGHGSYRGNFYNTNVRGDGFINRGGYYGNRGNYRGSSGNYYTNSINEGRGGFANRRGYHANRRGSKRQYNYS